MSRSLEDRSGAQIGGVLSCYDWIVIAGTFPTVCHAGGMTGGCVSDRAIERSLYTRLVSRSCRFQNVQRSEAIGQEPTPAGVGWKVSAAA
jgi:hypothetical protein